MNATRPDSQVFEPHETSPMLKPDSVSVDWDAMRLPEIAEEIAELIAQHGPDTILHVEGGDYPEFEVRFKREETEREAASRVKIEHDRNARRTLADLAQLAELKAKYEPADPSFANRLATSGQDRIERAADEA